MDTGGDLLPRRRMGLTWPETRIELRGASVEALLSRPADPPRSGAMLEVPMNRIADEI
jgi:hypothetical protein